MNFKPFPKIPRLSRECIITEKIDGTNASVTVEYKKLIEDDSWMNAICEVEDFIIFAGSRKRFITPENDNFGFARWVGNNAKELAQLGPGTHFGEWWGSGIQRNYGLTEKRFSLFNVGMWNADNPPPACCSIVPVVYTGLFETNTIEIALDLLREESLAAPGFTNPEGIMIYHTAANQYFKKTFEKDEGKGDD